MCIHNFTTLNIGSIMNGCITKHCSLFYKLVKNIHVIS